MDSNDTTSTDRKEPSVADEKEFAALPRLTGRMIWLDHQDCEGDFGPSRPAPENKWHARAQVGQQNGTYYRTARTQDGMTVWRWGRREESPCGASLAVINDHLRCERTDPHGQVGHSSRGVIWDGWHESARVEVEP